MSSYSSSSNSTQPSRGHGRLQLSSSEESSTKRTATWLENELYMEMKDLESKLEMIKIQEDYLKDEQRHLKSEYVRPKEEVSLFQKSLNQIFNFFK